MSPITFTDPFKQAVSDVLIKNELGGKSPYEIYHVPPSVSSTSGYSFGFVQWDLEE
jgi:hypothetical protein